MVSEMARVVRPGARVALALPTAPSFGEFFSVYWELLHNCALDQEANVETRSPNYTACLRSKPQPRTQAESVTSISRIEEFRYDSGEQFLNSPLVADFLMNAGWRLYLMTRALTLPRRFHE